MQRLFIRFLTGLGFALPMMLLATAWAQARPIADSLASAHTATSLTASTAVTVTTATGECGTCHADIQKAWENSKHAKGLSCSECHTSGLPSQSDATGGSHNHNEAVSGDCMSCHTTGYDPATNTWVAAGVACQACHNPIPANHAAEPSKEKVPVDRSAVTCGKCHTETYFEWQASQHRQNDLTCNGCHDSHAAGFKTAQPSDLCASCHKERATYFATTSHAEKGLTCATCHLNALTDKPQGGQAKRDHSFNVKLSSCNTCHAYQMHDPAAIHTEKAPDSAPVDAMMASTTAMVTVEPQPVSPIGFAALAGLIGLAAGMVLAPWLDKVYRRLK